MIESVVIYLPEGEIERLMVGKDGITKIFTDRDATHTLVVLSDKGITEYGNVTYIAQKAYKKE